MGPAGLPSTVDGAISQPAAWQRATSSLLSSSRCVAETCGVVK